MRLAPLLLQLTRIRQQSRRRQRGRRESSRTEDSHGLTTTFGLHRSIASVPHDDGVLSRAAKCLPVLLKHGSSRKKSAGCEAGRSSYSMHSGTGFGDQHSSRRDPPFPSAIPRPSTQEACTEPILLLEGDVLRVIDGVSRTRYRVEASSSSASKGRLRQSSFVAIEETHELATGKKQYALRRSPNMMFGEAEERLAHAAYPSLAQLGEVPIEIQEIAGDVGHQAGSSSVDWTGGSTWEASVAMALYFASHPHELMGHVLELGSGVGVGGILLLALQQQGFCAPHGLESLTLTDGNDGVVRQCRHNLFRAASCLVECVPVHVRGLNWCDGDELDRLAASSKFDTILASDCVYRRGDVPALAGAVARLLTKDERIPTSSGNAERCSQIHIFSPLNRSALPDFINELKGAGMHVVQETISVQRSRLGGQLEECSSNVSTFVHVAASHGRQPPTRSMSDVD